MLKDDVRKHNTRLSLRRFNCNWLNTRSVQRKWANGSACACHTDRKKWDTRLPRTSSIVSLPANPMRKQLLRRGDGETRLVQVRFDFGLVCSQKFVNDMFTSTAWLHGDRRKFLGPHEHRFCFALQHGSTDWSPEINDGESSAAISTAAATEKEHGSARKWKAQQVRRVKTNCFGLIEQPAPRLKFPNVATLHSWHFAAWSNARATLGLVFRIMHAISLHVFFQDNKGRSGKTRFVR